MELKPTEGEWTAYKRPVPVGYADWEIHWSPIGECVAEVVHTEADARLMAASKELLAALIEMESEKSNYMQINKLGDPALEHTNKLARAAIAKATGSAA